jgi:hypothetical protein
MTEAVDRAAEEWEILISPFPLYGELLYMIYFKHRHYSFKFFHRYYKSHREAQQEEKRLVKDLHALRTDKFKEKYRIGYDIKGSLL